MIDNTTQHFKFNPTTFTAPVSVGYWYWGNTQGRITFWATKRPNWFHQKMTYLFFGWEWADKENT